MRRIISLSQFLRPRNGFSCRFFSLGFGDRRAPNASSCATGGRLAGALSDGAIYGTDPAVSVANRYRNRGLFPCFYYWRVQLAAESELQSGAERPVHCSTGLPTCLKTTYLNSPGPLV